MDSSTAAVIGGAIPVVGGVISGLINNAATDANNAANRQFQLEQQDKQNAYNLQMWNMQNAYNAPSAIMQRYKDAGLNPNLIYGQATGNVAAAPAPSAKVDYVSQPHPAIDLGTAAARGVQAYNDLKLGAAQVNNMAAQQTNILQDTILKMSQQMLNIAQAGKTNVDANATSKLLPYQEDAAAADIRQKNSQTGLNDVLRDVEVQKNIRDAAYNSVTIREAIARIGQIAMQNAKTAAEIDNIKANTTNLLNSNQLQNMDIQMRNGGMMPHDSFIMRILGNAYQYITGSGNTAGGPTFPDTPVSQGIRRLNDYLSPVKIPF